MSLTRHSQSFTLFVNREETRDTNQLIRQMSRSGDKAASVNFTTREELQAEKQRQETSKPMQLLSNGLQKAWTNVGDYFHSNNEFYDYKPPAATPSPVIDKDDVFNIASRSHEEIQTKLETRLYNQHLKDHNKTPTAEEKLFNSKQASRATELLLTNEQTAPTYEQVENNIIMAGHELRKELKTAESKLPANTQSDVQTHTNDLQAIFKEFDSKAFASLDKEFKTEIKQMMSAEPHNAREYLETLRNEIHASQTLKQHGLNELIAKLSHTHVGRDTELMTDIMHYAAKDPEGARTMIQEQLRLQEKEHKKPEIHKDITVQKDIEKQINKANKEQENQVVIEQDKSRGLDR